MNPVMILTDSTAYLPPELVASYPIRIMPLVLIWDGQCYRDGIDIEATEFYQRLAVSSTLPTTSQVSAGEVDANLTALLAEGYDVLVLPISSGISSTYQTVLSRLGNFPAGRVAVLDTQTVAMGLGFQVLAAARCAAAGASLGDCKQAAKRAAERIGMYFTVDTLKFLAAGGRINSAKRLLGAALNIKPILEMRGGRIELVTSAVTRRKAVERMLNLVEQNIAGRQPVRISAFHANAKEAAQDLLETAQARFSPQECILSDVSPVIGAHVGPGTVAIAYQVGD